MLCAGDEIGRTQRGNNNAYVQDNPISWLDWDLDTPRTELLEFVRTLAAVRRAHPSFRRRAFLKSEDAIWLRPLARGEASTELPVMRGQDWADAAHAALGLLLRGAGPGCDPGDDDFILLANADPLPVVFVLPPAHWRVLADTQPSTSAVRPGTPGGAADSAVGSSSGQALDDAPLFSLSVGAGSLVLLARQSSSE